MGNQDGSKYRISLLQERRKVSKAMSINSNMVTITLVLSGNLQFALGYASSTLNFYKNAVCEFRGEVYALFHAPGVVANLTPRSIVIQNDNLQHAHNLIIEEQ